MAKLKTKTCQNKGCSVRFTQFNSIVVWCSPKCGQEIAQSKVKENYKKETHRMKKKHLDNDRKHQMKLAKDACHTYIRFRDRHLPCIDCSKDNVAQWQAGHYKTQGGFPALRFNEMNIHKQCSQCNKDGLRGQVLYRRNLVEKIGQRNVDWLEVDHPPQNLTLDDLKGIQWWYKLRLKMLQEEAEFEVFEPFQQRQ